MKTLSSDEVQEKLGISRPTLYLWVKQGKLSPQRAGRALRFEEDEVMRLLGKGPHVAAWIRGGRLEEAKREVRRWVRSGIRPALLLEYLSAPARDHVRARVVSGGDGGRVQHPVPGGVLFDALLESRKRRDFLFLSHEESVWWIHDVQAETSAGGESYIAVDLVRPDGPGEGDERDRHLKSFVALLREGIYTGKLSPWTRDELHERRSR